MTELTRFGRLVCWVFNRCVNCLGPKYGVPRSDKYCNSCEAL